MLPWAPSAGGLGKLWARPTAGLLPDNSTGLLSSDRAPGPLCPREELFPLSLLQIPLAAALAGLRGRGNP